MWSGGRRELAVIPASTHEVTSSQNAQNKSTRSLTPVMSPPMMLLQPSAAIGREDPKGAGVVVPQLSNDGLWWWDGGTTA